MKIGPVPLPPIWREGLLGLGACVAAAPPALPRPAGGARGPARDADPGLPDRRRADGDARLVAAPQRAPHPSLGNSPERGLLGGLDDPPRARAWRTSCAARASRRSLIGQSRGGLFARVLAVRRPDLVRSVVTLGSPHAQPVRGPPARVDPGRRDRRPGGARRAGPRKPSLPQRRVLRTTSCATSGRRCRRACTSCRSTRSATGSSTGRYASTASAVNVEVRSTHCGMAVNPEVYELLDAELHRASGAGRRRCGTRGRWLVQPR